MAASTIESEQDRLTAAGEALYGPRWQTEVANLVGVESRRVRQWLAGERPIPPRIWPALASELQRRSAHALKVAKKLKNT